MAVDFLNQTPKVTTKPNLSVVNTTTTGKDNEVLTTSDANQLKKIISESLIMAGIDKNDLSVQSATGVIIQGFDYLIEKNNIANVNRKIESSVLTAQKYKSLMNIAAQQSEELVLAIPSLMDVILAVNVDSVLAFGELTGSNTYTIYLKKNENSFNFGGVNFIQKYDTEVTVSVTGNTTNPYSAIVIRTDEKGNKITLAAQTTIFNNVYYVQYRELLVNIEVDETNTFSISNDNLDNFIVTTKLPIHSLDVTYVEKKTGATVPITIGLYRPQGNPTFLRYEILAVNKYNLIYTYDSMGTKFSKGSTIDVNANTTTGENIKYRANPTVNRTSYDSNLSLLTFPPNGEFYFSEGGKITANDKGSVRNYVIRTKGSRNRVDTEDDMKTYLGIYNGSSTFSPVEVRSDVQSRRFNIFTMLSVDSAEESTNSYIIPTDTAHAIDIPRSLLPPSVITPDNKSIILFDKDMLIYSNQQIIDGDTVVEYSADPAFAPSSTHTFVSPFRYALDNTSVMSNILRIYSKYMYDYSQPLYLKYTNLNNNIYNRFACNSATIYQTPGFQKDTPDDGDYKIHVNFSSEDAEFDVASGLAKVILEFKDYSKMHTFTLEGQLEAVSSTGMAYNRAVFDLTPDIDLKYLYNKYFKYQDQYCDITSEITVSFLLDLTGTGTGPYTKISEHKTEFNFFREVTEYVLGQHSMSSTDGNENLRLKYFNLVSDIFYKDSVVNVENIEKEILNVFAFLDSQHYLESDQYRGAGTNIREVIPTNYSICFNFVRTFGISRYMQIENYGFTELQIKPSFKVASDLNFNREQISIDYNNYLKNYDFKISYLHMSSFVKDVMNTYPNDVKSLQFTSFLRNVPYLNEQVDRYKLQMDNTLVKTSIDGLQTEFMIPEVVSLSPVYDPSIALYRYDVEYIDV